MEKIRGWDSKRKESASHLPFCTSGVGPAHLLSLSTPPRFLCPLHPRAQSRHLRATRCTAKMPQANPQCIPFYLPHHQLPSNFRIFMTRENTSGGESPAGTVGPGAVFHAGCWRNPILIWNLPKLSLELIVREHIWTPTKCLEEPFFSLPPPWRRPAGQGLCLTRPLKRLN